MFSRARRCEHALIVVDEAEYLFGCRTSKGSEALTAIQSELLTEMGDVVSSAEKRIVFIATTSRPQDIDPAFIRRFEDFVYVKLPDRGAMQLMIQHHLSAYELDDDVNPMSLNVLATHLASKRNLSGDDVRQAMEVALRSLLDSPYQAATHFKEVSVLPYATLRHTKTDIID